MPQSPPRTTITQEEFAEYARENNATVIVVVPNDPQPSVYDPQPKGRAERLFQQQCRRDEDIAINGVADIDRPAKKNMTRIQELIQAGKLLADYARETNHGVCDIDYALQTAVRSELMAATGYSMDKDSEDIEAQAAAGRYCLKLLGADAAAMHDGAAAGLFWHITTSVPEIVAEAIVTSG